MRRIILAGLATALAATATASAQQAERNFDDTGFDRIDISGQFDARIEIGESYAIRMSGDSSDMDRLRVETGDGELNVRARNRWFGNGGSMDVSLVITMPAIEAAEFSRGVSAQLTGVDASGFTLEVSTGAFAEVTGTCSRLDAEVSTGGVLRARALECAHVSAEASTGGEGEVFASERIDAEASTGGALEVFGSPPSQSRESSLGGSIRIVSGS